MFPLVKFLNGEQFQAGNTQFLKKRYLFYYPPVRPRMSRPGIGVYREAPDVRFVEYAEPEGVIEGGIPLPVEVVVIYHHTLGLGVEIVLTGKRKVPGIGVVAQAGFKVPARQ
jgi:hypothetical protein